MYNILYENGIVYSDSKPIVNIRKPFHSKIDKDIRKASIKKLLVSPEDTRSSAQIKRFVVPYSSKFAYKMNTTYIEDFKCQSIYNTSKNINKILKSKILKHVVEDIKKYPSLKADIIKVIKLVRDAWEFDYIITDVPWLSGFNFGIPVVCPDWRITKYENHTPTGKAINLLLKEYKTIPINLMSYNHLSNLPIEYTNMPKELDYKCPLILMSTNAVYSAYISNVYNKGLPVTLFKVSRME